MRDNGNREAFGLGAGSGVVKVVDWTRTEHQVKPHDGFASGVVWARETDRPASEAPPTMRLAEPPKWAQRDDLPCIKRVPKGNQPDPYDTSNRARAAALCAGCPVKAECLADALAEEGDLSAKSRYLVRGGLTPRGRASHPLG